MYIMYTSQICSPYKTPTWTSELSTFPRCTPLHIFFDLVLEIFLCVCNLIQLIFFERSSKLLTYIYKKERVLGRARASNYNPGLRMTARASKSN
jgi:hypothetical protein